MTRAQLTASINTLITDPTNKQNTAARVRQALANLIANCANLDEDEFGATITNTDELSEGTANLYFTAARAVAALAGTLDYYLKYTDIVNNLVTTNTAKALSAQQGKVLQDTKVDKLATAQNQSVLFWKNTLAHQASNFTWDDVLKILKLKAELSTIVPRLEVANSNNSSVYLERTETGNSAKLKNKVLQASGVGRAIVSTVSQYIVAAPANNTSQSIYTNVTFAFSFWIKMSPGASGPLLQWIDQYPAFYINNTGSITLRVDSYNTPDFRDNQWHHLVINYSGGQFSFYIDNIARGNTFNTGVLLEWMTANGKCIMLNESAAFLNAAIDQLLVYDRPLIPLEISSIYNFGTGTGSPPATANLRRRFEFEENTGTSFSDSIFSTTGTIFNSQGTSDWTAGLVPAAGTVSEATIIESSDGLQKGERGIHKFGEYNGRTVLYGKYAKVQLNDNLTPVFVDDNGRILLDLATLETDNYVLVIQHKLTAKLNIGAPNTTTAGLRLLAGTENTSNKYLGDTNHVLAQRTIAKRKGATDLDSVALTEIDCLFSQTNTITASASGAGVPATLLGTLIGTKTIPPNFWAVGKVLELDIEGPITMSNTSETLQFAVKLNGTTIFASGGITFGILGSANGFFRLRVKIKCESVGASGTIRATGEANVDRANKARYGTYNANAITIDTTQAQTLDATIVNDSNNSWTCQSTIATCTVCN